MAMIYADVIIVGGGPAGAACSGHLSKAGVSNIVLDKRDFPREKICAGWITPAVMKVLGIKAADYPFNIREFRQFHLHVRNRLFKLPTRQYAIRRLEFDQWLHEHYDVHPVRHVVKNIRRTHKGFIIDETFECRFLIGAAGTHCPVSKQFFQKRYPRNPLNFIAAVEAEIHCPWKDPHCHLWFFDHGLPGYSWYVPKGNGILNIGIGGQITKIKDRRMNILKHWNLFVEKLESLSLISAENIRPRGHNYYIRGKENIYSSEGVFLIGDSAGLATRDLGEGIGPAIQSGILTASSIRDRRRLSYKKIARFSLPGMFFAGFS